MGRKMFICRKALDRGKGRTGVPPNTVHLIIFIINGLTFRWGRGPRLLTGNFGRGLHLIVRGWLCPRLLDTFALPTSINS